MSKNTTFVKQRVRLVQIIVTCFLKKKVENRILPDTLAIQIISSKVLR